MDSLEENLREENSELKTRDKKGTVRFLFFWAPLSNFHFLFENPPEKHTGLAMAAAAKIPTAAEIIQMKIKALLSDATEVATSWKLAHSVVIDGEGQFIDQVRAHKAWKDDSYIELFCFAGIHLPFLVHFTPFQF